jgi:hypothetical protein
MEAVALMEACKREYELAKRGGYELPLLISLSAAVGLVASLQLALRHPEMKGPSEKIARGVVAAMIQRTRDDGFVACAELMELGNDPANDQ